MLRRSIIIAVVALAALGGCAGIWASSLHFEVVRGYLDSLAGDGSAEPYTPQLHTRLRIYFACLGVAGLCVTGWLVHELRRERTDGSVLIRFATDAQQLRVAYLAVLHRHCVAILVLSALGLIIRLPWINQPIRYDEAHSFVNYADKPAYLTISTYKEPNNHVFHNLCVHAVTRVLGDAEWAIRLTALTAGTLLVPTTYLLGTSWAGPAAGWLAALAVAASSPLIGYSVNARGYTLLSLITVCLILLGQSTLRRDNLAAWGAMAFSTAIGFWTVPTMLYPYALVVVWLGALRLCTPVPATSDWWRRLAISIVVAAGLTVVLYSPILMVEGPTAFFGNHLIVSPEWPEFIRTFPSTFAETQSLLLRDVPLPTVALLVIGWIAALRPGQMKAQPAAGLLLLASTICLLLVLVQRVLPPPRIWLFLVPLWLSVAAFGLHSLMASGSARARTASLVSISILLVAWPLANLFRHDSVRRSCEGGVCPDAQAAVLWLKQGLLPREPIVAIVPASAPLVYYAGRHELPLTHFEWPGGPHTRDDTAIVVVNQACGRRDTPHDVLAALDLAQAYASSQFRVVKEFASAKLVRATQSTVAD